jgi:hypothetical protein
MCHIVIAITLLYVFALSHNASTVRREVIASLNYHSGLIEIDLTGFVISSDSFHAKVINCYLLLLIIMLLTVSVRLGPLHGVVRGLSFSGTGGGGGFPLRIGKQEAGTYSHRWASLTRNLTS